MTSLHLKTENPIKCLELCVCEPAPPFYILFSLFSRSFANIIFNINEYTSVNHLASGLQISRWFFSLNLIWLFFLNDITFSMQAARSEIGTCDARNAIHCDR